MRVFSFTRSIILLITVGVINGRIFYVDQQAHASTLRDGSWESPFETIAECVEALGSPGDECQIREGVYKETVTITGLKGTADSPIVIQGYGEERPMLDGTVELVPEGGQWEQMGDIYFGKIQDSIWQLFFDDLLMTNARWPNANWSEKTVFDGRNHWAQTSTSSERGRIENRGPSLEESGLDMTGAMAVLNIGAWNTFVAEVTSHSPGTNEFTYDDTFGRIKLKFKVGRYFIEDKLELLDAPEEWFFDKSTNYLYFIPPTGSAMTSTTILRGKVQTYAVTVTDSEHLVFKNLDFFGTTLRAIPQERLYVDHLRLDSLNFNYPCASKRMLQDPSVTECTNVNGKQPRRFRSGTFVFFNNTFHGADGIPLTYLAEESRLENNLFTYNDWTSANSRVGNGGAATVLSRSMHDTAIRNTLLYNGEGHGIRPTRNPYTTLNRVVGQCWGMQQNDGAGIHLTINNQPQSHIHRNWVHDSPKYGIRFDGTPPRVGVNGTISSNVAVRLEAGGVQMKGDWHTALNNLAFDAEDGTTRDYRGCSLCVWKYVRRNPVEINKYSTVVGNVADVANGGKRLRADVYPLNGLNITDNVVDPGVKSYLRDPDNYDFRPLGTVITVGPYDADPSTYWIPGRQEYKPSSPVPPTGSTTVIAANRDALMWLPGLGHVTHHVYFGDSAEEVALADVSHAVGLVSGNVNLMKIGRELKAGTRYYWRVDGTSRDGHVVKGDIWWFETI